MRSPSSPVSPPVQLGVAIHILSLKRPSTRPHPHRLKEHPDGA